MVFTSIEYLVFFPLVVIFYFIIPPRFRWLFLLAASYYFYMSWKPEYVFLLLFSTLVDYYSGIMMGSTDSESRKRKFLYLSLVSNLTILFSFKYFNFINDSARDIFNQLNIFYNVPSFNVLLPVGISFYIFQSLSYSIDVYTGVKEPEKHLGIFALYVSFFPQLVAGPIERSTRLLPQFYEKKKFDHQQVSDGLKLILWGFFKKIVIADRLALYVNQVYNSPAEYYGLHILLATYFFAYQIYCDFSAYSDIAKGSALVMGYELMDNFNTPYSSKDIAEFWRRWHISLSTWFRDYVFTPLNFKLRYFQLTGISISIFVTFLICGIWHGANWTFVIWGILHGFYFVFSTWTKDWRIKLSSFLHLDKNPGIHNFIKIFLTFHLVSFGWIFFRSNSIADAMLILNNTLIINPGQLESLELALGWYELLFAFAAIVFLELVQSSSKQRDIVALLKDKPLLTRYIFYYIMILGILLFGQFENSEFIYFQF